MKKYHGRTVDFWKQNAEEDYLKTPISVLKYITVLEEQAGEKLKIYRCEFDGLNPVGNCLVLAAYDQKQAEEIARKTIKHTTEIVVNELSLEEPQIIEYLSGDY